MATLKDRLRDILDNRIRATARRVMNTPLPQSLQAPTKALNQTTRAVEKHPWIGAPVRMVKGRGEEQAKLLTSSAQDFSQGKPVQGALKAAGFGLSLTPPGAGSAALMGGLSALGAPSGDRARAFGRGTTYASIFGKGSQITNPFINKAITGMGLGQKTGFVASRAVPALANVAQGIGLDRTAGTPTTPTSIGLDLAAGLVGGRGSFASSGAIRGAKAVKPRLTMKGNDPGELTQMYNAIRKMNLDEMVSDRLGMVKNFNDTASHYLKKLGFKATQISKMTEAEKWRILSPHVQENVMYRVGDVPVMGITQKKTIEPIEDELIQEARKYKSAEEFIKAQGKPLFHGSKTYKSGRLMAGSSKASRGSAIYATPDVKQAKNYGNLNEIYLDKKAKYFNFDNATPTQIKNDIMSYLRKNNISFEEKDGFIYSDIGNIDTFSKSKASFNRFIESAGKDKYFRDLGYDVATFGEGERQVAIYNPNVATTKSQLTDLWNQAQKTKPENVMYRVGDVPVMGISSPKDIRTSQSLLGELGDTSKSNKLQLDETTTRTSATEVTSLKPIIPKKGKKKGKLNLENLAVDEIGKKALMEMNEDLPVSVISNKSVVDRARTAKGTKALTDEKMRDIIAQQLKNRQKVVDLAAQFSNAKKNGASEEELAKIMLEISEQSRVAQQGGTFAGRLLQAQNIMADRSATPMQKVLALLDNAGVKEEKYLKDAVKVNWEDPIEVVRFYRKYVPPSLGEVLTEVRYTNMLSSPMTHIVNIASNALQTAVVAPLEKTISGAIDAFRSALTKSERKYYANAGIEYTKGYVKALPRAIKKALDILSQKEISVKPDLEYVPTGVGGKLGAYTIPLRALEAMDQFFKTLVEGGVSRELRSAPGNLPSTKIAKIASQEAEYRLFRQKFDPTGELGQGYVLQLFDLWNSAILNLRRLPGGKWILPFMQTPTNILKQGLEYSPLGVVTIPGSKNATEQLSKSIIGSGVFLAAYQLAKSGLTTWSAPTGEKERELYYAAGLQPYSVKIGDKWVSYSKLGPLSYPLAMAAALANAERTKPDQETKNNIAESIGGILAFFGDQSYVKNIGDLVDAIQGGVSVGPTAISSQAANLAGQLVPYRSFLTWLGRITDPTYRKAKTFKERMVKDIPVIGSDLEPYRDPFGNPSMRDLPLVNAFFPARISVEKQPAESEYRLYEKGRIQRGVEKRSGEKLIQEGGSNQISTNKYQYLDDEGSVKTINIGKVLSMPENNAINRAKKDKEVWKTADDILNSKLAPNLQAQALQKLGVDIEQAEYYNIAKETNDLKYLYIEEEINKIISTTKNREDVLKFLVKQRQEVGGKVILSSGVIDDLRKAGYISKAEADKLKNITFDGKTKIPQVSVSGRGGGATLKSIKLTAPKMGSIRGKIPSLAQTKITPPSAKDPFGIKQFNPQDVVRQFSKQVQASQEAVARIRPISRSSFNI